MVEALENLFVNVEGSIFAHRHRHMHNSVQRCLYGHVLMDLLSTCDAQEDISKGTANWASEQILVGASFNCVLDDAFVVESVIAADKGKCERTSANL